MNLVSEIMPTTSDAVPLIGRHLQQQQQPILENKQKSDQLKPTTFLFFMGHAYSFIFFNYFYFRMGFLV